MRADDGANAGGGSDEPSPSCLLLVAVKVVDLDEFLREIRHFDGAAGAVAALHVEAFLSLFVVFGREHAVGDRDAVVERDARDAGAGLVRDEFEVVRFAADDGAQGNGRRIRRCPRASGARTGFPGRPGRSPS